MERAESKMKKNAVYLEQKSWPLFIVGVETVSLTPRFLRVFFGFFFFFPLLRNHDFRREVAITRFSVLLANF